MAILALLIATAGFPAVSHAAVSAASPSQPEEVWEWNSVNLQGMGWVTGLVIQKTAPHLIYIKTDVGGAYRYDRNEKTWINLHFGINMDDKHEASIESIAIDPRDSEAVYVAVNGTHGTGGEVYQSLDRGATWLSTGLKQHEVYIGGNDSLRAEIGERLTVDPANSTLYFASRNDGLWRKPVDREWSKVDGLPTGAFCEKDAGCGGFSFVAFDEAAGTAGNGNTGVFYVGAFGQGVYKTADGGETFALMSGPSQPHEKQPMRAVVAANGTLFVTSSTVDNSKGTVWRAGRGSAALTKTLDSSLHAQVDIKKIVGIDVHPADPDIVYAQAGDSNGGHAWMYESADGGLTWTPKQQTKLSEPAWYPAWWSSHERAPFVIDPLDPTTAWSTTGFSVLEIKDIDTSEPQAIANMHGIEELVGYIAKTPPMDGGFDVHVGAADTGGFSVRDRDIVPDTRLMSQRYDGYPMWGVNLTQISGMDYSYQNPEHIAYTGYHQFALWNGDPRHFFGRSKDGGRTWEEMMNPAGFTELGGMVAMSSTNPDNLVWSPYDTEAMLGREEENAVYLKYSMDGGDTWQEATGPFADGNSYDHFYERGNAWWSGTQNLASDKVNGNKFYLFTEKSALTAEFYMSSDGGRTWTKTYTGFEATWDQDWTAPNPEQLVNYQKLPFTNVKVNPAREGDVFLIGKPAEGSDVYPLPFRSTDSTVTDFKPLPNVQAAIDIAFGRGDMPDQPYIYLYGKANGDEKSGVYVSKDNAETWIKLTGENQSFGRTNHIEADMRYKHRVYLAMDGFGFVYGQPAGLPKVNVTHVSGTQEMDNALQEGLVFQSGADVTVQASASAEPGSTIEKVEFFAGGKKIGEDSSAPYTWTIEDAEPGAYYIVAKATDNMGREQHSSPSDFSVINHTEVVSVNYKNEDGTSASSLLPNQILRVDAVVGNLTSDAQSVQMVVALEDENGNPVQLANVSSSLAAKRQSTYSASLKLPANIDGMQVSVYVWDDRRTGELEPVSTVPDTLAPSWPATAKLYYTDRGDRSVRLYWADAQDDREVASYEVLMNGSRAALLQGAAFSKQYAVTGLQPDTHYEFTIVARDHNGNVSEAIAPVQLKTKTAGGEDHPDPVLPPSGTPVEPMEPSLILDARMEGSTAVAAIGVKEWQRALRAEGESAKSVSFAIRGIGDASSLRIRLTADIIKDALEKGIGSIGLHSDLISYVISTSFAQELQRDSVVELAAKKVARNELTKSVSNWAGSAVVYDLQLEVDGKPVHEFVRADDVQVSLPFALTQNGDASRAVAYYINDEGGIEVVRNSRYSPLTQEVTFYAKHFSLYTAKLASVRFVDLKSVPWAQEAITGLAAREIVKGVGRESFAPDRTVTRAEFIKMLVPALELYKDGAKAAFTDVRQEDWFAAEVASAYELNIVKGYENGEFAPDQSITREEMAAMAYRALQAAGLDVNGSGNAIPYHDASAVSGYAKEAIAALNKAGIMTGKGNGIFDPQSLATRAEAAQIIYRLFRQGV
jgi:hypothetical protein